MPAAPLVGAVTTRRPAAFSSFTASANAPSHSPGSSRRPSASAASSCSRIADARRFTCRSPGSTPSVCRPASTHAAIVSQIASRPAAISSSVRSACSLIRAASAIVMPRSSQSSISASALAKSSGYACACTPEVRLAVAPDESAADGVVGLAEDQAGIAALGAAPSTPGTRSRSTAPRRPVRHRPGSRRSPTPRVTSRSGRRQACAGAKSMSLRANGWGACRRVRERRPSCHPDQAERTASGSTVSGSRPCSPATTASGVPCPMPVAPSEPYSVQVTRSTPASSPSSRRRVAKSRAARMGPTVWELEGPTPMENSSNAET